MSPVYGVTEEVGAKMAAVEATVLREDNLLLRVCSHGVRHPVWHLSRSLLTTDIEQHEVGTEHGDRRRVTCCAERCCHAWVPLFAAEVARTEAVTK